MSYFTMVFVLVVVAVIGLVAMTARITLSENSKVLQRISDALQRVRLFRMLQKQRVDVQRYLQATDVSEIRRHIARCESCTSGQTCESALGSEETALDDFSFCPNSAAIERVRSSMSRLQKNPQTPATGCCRA